MPIKIVETGSLDDKHSSKRRPAKWKIKEPQPLPRRPETIDPQRKRYKDLLDRKQREMTDPTKKKKYQDLLDRIPKPIQPSRILTPEMREKIKKHLLKTGRPKIAKKGWK